MKVILLVNDKKLGSKDAIVDVADSYARNVLIPKNIAVEATAENIARRDARIAKEKMEFDRKVENAKLLKAKIEQIDAVVLRVKSNNGKMYGTVTSKDIAEYLLTVFGLEVKKQDVVVKDTIKTFGEYDATVKLFNGVSANFKVVVVKE